MGPGLREGGFTAGGDGVGGFVSEAGDGSSAGSG